MTALTGCAATLINAQTIHSYLCLGIGNDSAVKIYDKNKMKLQKLKNLNAIIIDEISMMNGNLLCTINDLFMIARDNNKKPFGGVQIIFVGDFFQLPPVDGMYCFQDDIWNTLNLNIIILNELMRQKDDIEFQLILNEIRSGRCSKELSLIHI